MPTNKQLVSSEHWSLNLPVFQINNGMNAIRNVVPYSQITQKKKNLVGPADAYVLCRAKAECNFHIKVILSIGS